MSLEQQLRTAQLLPVDVGYSQAAAITPSASAIANAPCDAMTVSATATVTLTMSGGGAWTGTMIAGYVYPMRATVVSSVSTGTLTALWH